MSIQAIVKNELIQDDLQVWRLKEHNQFGYSDGASSEKYLRKVFNQAKDLSSRSTELEKYIKDWPSEYHLSKKRSQLLSGFSFDRSKKVLEVGCGCGAITRFLGETFDEVVAIEGNINRARLAKQRTKDLDSISVICSPFQEINFSEKFDIIFCIGVFEYSASFIDGEDPYDAALKYFSNLLTPNGMVIIAIENQFGLKYFNGAREDHLGVRFEGLEGYHQKPDKVRTFGKVELNNMLKKYFANVEFFYPFPDYKIPDCVVSNEFLSSGRAGELIAQLSSRDYAGPEKFLWDEAAATLELARNGMLEFFSNSFLVVATVSDMKKIFGQEALLYSDGRKPEYSTQTRIVKEPSGELRVTKRREAEPNIKHQKSLHMIEAESSWIDTQSLHTRVSLLARAQNKNFKEIFEPCQSWLEFLKKNSSTQNGVSWLDGKHIDVTWSNTYFVNNECVIIDQEWVWHEKISLNVIVIRAIYDFLCRIERNALQARNFSTKGGKSLIKEIATSLGVTLTDKDFKAFIDIESQIAEIVTKRKKSQHRFSIKWYLFDRPSWRLMRWAKPTLRSILSRITARVSNLLRV